MPISLRDAFASAWRSARFDAGETSVVACLFQLDAWMPWVEAAGTVLDDAERTRARRMRRATDQSARLLAYALHRMVVAAVSDLDPARVPMTRDDNGRPLSGIPGLQTSLSHADGAIAVATCSSGPVGIDVEHVGRASGIVEIAGEICHDAERDLLAEDVASVERDLLELWARKEAYLKASGVGLAHPMRAFVLSEGARLPLVGEAPVMVRVQTLPLSGRYVMALACPDDARIGAARLLPHGSSPD